MLSFWVDKDGYNRVRLCHKGKPSNHFVHRLVAIAFIGSCPDQYQVCHIDGSKKNNFVDNLRYGTSKENSADSIPHGTQPRGGAHGRSKLNEKDVRAILRDARSERIIASEYGVSYAAIGHIKRGKNWKHLN